MMYQTSTNITPKYRQETRYNYVRSSVFGGSYCFFLCSPLLHYHCVSTALTVQIPTETLSQTHRVFIVLRFCAIVSLALHLPHKFLRKRYRKLTGFASCFCTSTALTVQIPNGNAITNSQGLLHTETGFCYFGA